MAAPTTENGSIVRERGEDVFDGGEATVGSDGQQHATHAAFAERRQNSIATHLAGVAGVEWSHGVGNLGMTASATERMSAHTALTGRPVAVAR